MPPFEIELEPDRRDVEVGEQLEPARDYDELIYWPRAGDPMEVQVCGFSFSAHLPMLVPRDLMMEVIEAGKPKQVSVIEVLRKNPHFRIKGEPMALSSEHVSIAATVQLALEEL